MKTQKLIGLTFALAPLNYMFRLLNSLIAYSIADGLGYSDLGCYVNAFTPALNNTIYVSGTQKGALQQLGFIS